jgi:hypothetical protein
MLFTLDSDNRIVLNADVLGIPVFRRVWENYPPEEAEKYMALIYYSSSTDLKNPYHVYPSKERQARLYTEFLKVDPATYKLPEDIKACIIQYRSFQTSTPGLRLLASARKALDELSEYLNNVDYTKVSKEGIPLYDPVKVSALLKNVGPVMEAFDKMKTRVEKEQTDKENNIRGGGEKGMFE